MAIKIVVVYFILILFDRMARKKPFESVGERKRTFFKCFKEVKRKEKEKEHGMDREKERIVWSAFHRILELFFYVWLFLVARISQRRRN